MKRVKDHLAILVAARKLIEKEENFCSNTLSVEDSRGAVIARCAVQALSDASGHNYAEVLPLLYAQFPKRVPHFAALISGRYGHKRTLEVFDKTIAKLSRKGVKDAN